MHKKAQSLAEADPLLFLNNYLHTHHTLAYRDLLSGNKKRFCLATDTIKVLSSSGWTSARSPGHLQNTAHPQLIWHWRWMDGYVWVSDGRFVGEDEGGRLSRDGGGGGVVLYSLTRGRAEAHRQQQLPPFWRHKTKRAPSVPLASGPPSLPQGESAPVPRALPSILASPLFLFLAGAVCSARQNNVKQGPDPRPKPPWTNCFHLRPTFLDDPVWQTGWWIKTV